MHGRPDRPRKGDAMKQTIPCVTGALAALLAALAVHASPVAAPSTGPLILMGGTVHVGDGRVLPDTTVIIAGGRIVNMGEIIPLVPGARVIECKGRHVTPGLMAADTVLGLTELGSAREAVGAATGRAAARPESTLAARYELARSSLAHASGKTSEARGVLEGVRARALSRGFLGIAREAERRLLSMP